MKYTLKIDCNNQKPVFMQAPEGLGAELATAPATIVSERSNGMPKYGQMYEADVISMLLSTKPEWAYLLKNANRVTLYRIDAISVDKLVLC